MKYSENAQFHDYCKQFDLVALYETWQRSENDFRNFMQGFMNFDAIRKKSRNVFRGSGGVSVFVKDWVMQTAGVTRIFQHFDECIVLLFNGNTFRRNEDIIMVFAYVAPENSPIYTDENNGLILLNEKISEILSQYPTAELLVAGDLNARIGKLQDYIPFDGLDFVFGDTDYPTDPFNINKQSKDDTCNRFGMSLIDLCCIHGLHALNGRMFDDKAGEITCVANDGSSVVDYMLASTSLFDCFSHFEVAPEDFSDHFPLQCRLNLLYEGNQSSQFFESGLNEKNG